MSKLPSQDRDMLARLEEQEVRLMKQIYELPPAYREVALKNHMAIDSEFNRRMAILDKCSELSRKRFNIAFGGHLLALAGSFLLYAYWSFFILLMPVIVIIYMLTLSYISKWSYKEYFDIIDDPYPILSIINENKNVNN